MYLFYEIIKKEIDLQDLVEYLNEPLEKLKLLQIKLQEYKNQNLKENKIEIEDLIRETDKLEQSVFPDLINNYCKLSLEFRNNNIIKEGKDKSGNKISYTSKDLLLKNIAKLIEHIDMLDEKFYTYFSFDFLVNSRIISDLGYQENFIDDNEKDPVVLKNKYVFSKEDARKIIDQQLGLNSNLNEITTNKNLNKSNLSAQTKLQLKKDDTNEEIEEIFNKKQQDKELDNAAQQHNEDFEKENVESEDDTVVSYGFSLIEVLLVIGFIFLSLIGTFILYGKVSQQQEKNIAFKQQQEKIRQLQAQNDIDSTMMSTNELLQELNANKEKNSINYQEGIDNSYKEVSKLMNKSIEWKQTNNNEKNELNYMNLIQNGYTLQDGYKLVDNENILSNNQMFSLNMKNDKVEVKVSNVLKNECQYMGIKLSSQYEIKVNDKDLTSENTKQVCELTNTISILEK